MIPEPFAEPPMSTVSLEEIPISPSLPIAPSLPNGTMFSDHDPVTEESHNGRSEEQSFAGTSAPLLTNPSLSDMFSTFPPWPNRSDAAPLETATDTVTMPAPSGHGHPYKHRGRICRNPPRQAAQAASSRNDASQSSLHPRRRQRGRPRGHSQPPPPTSSESAYSQGNAYDSIQ